MKYGLPDHKVAPPNENGCELWLGYVNPDGYGNTGGRFVHRVAYASVYGPIPGGLEIDHLCYVHNCVNPEHLQTATHKENAENVERLRSDNTSGVRGVSFARGRGKWVVTVQHHGQKHFGGHFTDLAEAEQAAVALRNRLHTNNRKDRTT